MRHSIFAAMLSTITQAAVVVVLMIGAALRTVQYVATASMSADEAAVALNVVDRGWRELLFQPLMHDQVAPLGFLFLEKVSVSIAGNNEAAFRFFPYLLSLVSLILFWRVSTRYLQTQAMLAALIVFAVSPTLVLYAGVAKQYSGDIAVTLFLLWMVLGYLEEPTRYAHGVAVGIAGGAVLLLSQPAVLVAFGLGALLLVEGRRVGKPAGQLFTICAGWFVGAAIVTYTSLTAISASTSAYMEDFWEHDFVPRPWDGLAELVWIPARLVEFISYLVAYINSPSSLPEIALGTIYGLLLLLGILHLVKRDFRTAVLLAVPVIVAIIAASVRLLPLSARVSLFIGPSLLIGCFAGFDRIQSWLPPHRGNLALAAALGLATLPALALLTLSPPPKILGGTLPVLQEVKAHWLPEDKLVVSRGRWTRISTKYYGRRFGLEDLTHIDRVRGNYTAEQVLRGYLRRIDAFRGVPRTWFYFEGTVACEEEAILGYLTAIGMRLYSVDFPLNKVSKVSAHLYDLSDAELLGHADADTYQVPECKG
jgi:4-amino-4-deoxy-L-arabinose transferase-like glycosyltransferase